MASASALQLKEEGNKHFQSGDYTSADALYSKALIHDSTNPLLYTNRAMARLKLHMYDAVIADCDASLALLEHNMKAYYYKSQAQLELGMPKEGLESAMKAYELCTSPGAERSWERSLSSVVGIVLRGKKEVWEQRERQRKRTRDGLLEECIRGLEKGRDEELRHYGEEAENESEREHIKRQWEAKIEELRRVWERGQGEKRREVPDWAVDDITFSIMVDPVVTKTGQSYDRASITEHLRRSQTDPLTREPLKVEELRPNLGLKKACAEFLDENGWAVDW